MRSFGIGVAHFWKTTIKPKSHIEPFSWITYIEHLKNIMPLNLIEDWNDLNRKGSSKEKESSKERPGSGGGHLSGGEA